MKTLKAKEFCIEESADGDTYMEWNSGRAVNFIKVRLGAVLPIKSLLKESGYVEVHE